MSRRKKAGQTHSKQMTSRSSEDVTKLKYFGTTLTDQNCMLEEIERRLNSVQSLLSSRLLSTNVMVKIYKTIILPVFCMGVKLGLSL
jgi:hypothetical protein